MEKLDSIVSEFVAFVNDLKQDKIVVALPGGRSIVPFLTQLKNEKLPWEKMHFFMVDERLVPIQDKESNFRHVSEIFFSDLIAKGKLSPFNLHPYNYKKGTSEYETELKSFGGKFDIIIFGVGEDGHIGGLFPNYTINDESDFFIEFHDSPKPPKDRMSASRKLVEKAKLAVLLFVGDKKEAYEHFNDEKTSHLDCPAKLMKKIKHLVYFSEK
jgi:6-phosphogluconolactonase